MSRLSLCSVWSRSSVPSSRSVSVVCVVEALLRRLRKAEPDSV
jgi:hypothetical protein